MTSIHVKFRASSVEDKEGTLYYHLIHQCATRWISTHYRIFPHEWSDKNGCIIKGKKNERNALLNLIQSKVDWEMQQMRRIIHDKEAVYNDFTIDELADTLRHLPSCQSVFTFIEALIGQKEKMQCFGTRNNCLYAYQRFRMFRHAKDLTFSQMTADMMEQYEAWLRSQGCAKTPLPTISGPSAHSITKL